MKKILAILLTAVMLMSTLSILPFSAFAVEVDEDETPLEKAHWISDGAGNPAFKPLGEGTEGNPYRISSLENLKWLAAEIKNSETNDVYGAKTNGCYQSFKGVYFEQTRDIDLGGSAFTGIGSGYICDPSIVGSSDANKNGGYLYASAFGGFYDGNGFSIKNGIIKSGGTKNNLNWASGFFPVIYGATIKNMVFENIEFEHSTMLNGNVVGVAHAPITATIEVYKQDTTTKNDNDFVEGTKETITNPGGTEGVGNPNFNVIENIVVKASCTVNAKVPNVNGGSILGGIVGRAISTTVRNCVNEADISSERGHVATGAIVAEGGAMVIENCINKGDVTVTFPEDATVKADKFTWEAAVGGILGFMIDATNANNTMNLPSGTVKIRNCYNSGELFMNTKSGDVGFGKAFYWGGILGGLNTPQVVEPTAEDPYPFLIENCHNTAPLTRGTSSNSAPGTNVPTISSMRFAGIVGSSWSGAKSEFSPMYVKDCFSVDVQEGTYVGTNEVRHQTNACTYAGAAARPVLLLGVNVWKNTTTKRTNLNEESGNTLATRALTDYIYEYDAASDTVALSTTTTFQDLIDAIDAAVADAHTVVTAKGYQEHLTEEGTYRLILGVHDLSVNKVGIKMTSTRSGGAQSQPVVTEETTVYDSFVAVVPDTESSEPNATKEVTYTAADLGAAYVVLFDLEGLILVDADPATADTTDVYTVTTFVNTHSDAVIEGDVIQITVVDGVVDSIQVNP